MIRLDDLHIKGYKIFQESDGFCFGTDAVLLAWFSGNKKFKKTVDLCSGNGIIPVLLSVHPCCEKIVGVEIQTSQIELAKRTVEYNGLCGKIEMLNADLRDIAPKKLLARAEYDLVTVNPPYMPKDSGFVADGGKGVARTELACSLSDVVFAGNYLLKNGGRFCIINRADRLTDIICCMRENGLEPKRLLTVSARAEKPPMLVLVEGVKGGKTGLTVEPPLFIHGSDGEYTPILKEIYSGREEL